MSELYEIRVLLNYEDMLIAHQRRKELEVSRIIEEAAKISLEAARKVTKLCCDVFISWLEDLIKSVNDTLRTAYIHHLDDELSQFNVLIERIRKGHAYFAISRIVPEKLNRLRKEYSEVFKNPKISQYIKGFMQQTYVFRSKEVLYGNLRRHTDELKHELKLNPL